MEYASKIKWKENISLVKYNLILEFDSNKIKKEKYDDYFKFIIWYLFIRFYF